MPNPTHSWTRGYPVVYSTQESKLDRARKARPLNSNLPDWEQNKATIRSSAQPLSSIPPPPPRGPSSSGIFLQQNHDMTGHRSALPDGVYFFVRPCLDVHSPGGGVQQAHDVGSHQRLDIHHLGRGGDERREYKTVPRHKAWHERNKERKQRKIERWFASCCMSMYFYWRDDWHR